MKRIIIVQQREGKIEGKYILHVQLSESIKVEILCGEVKSRLVVPKKALEAVT